jgi:hypothetical protein
MRAIDAATAAMRMTSIVALHGIAHTCISISQTIDVRHRIP